MTKEEHLDMNTIKSEPCDGEFSTRDIVSELLGASVPSSTNQEPEPMDQDVSVVNTSHLVVPVTTTNAAVQWTTNSNVPTFDVVTPNVSTGTLTIPHVNTATGAVKTVQLQTINNLINKPTSLNQPTGTKQIYLATSNSPNKLITIQTNKAQSMAQGLRPTNLSTQLQFVAGGLKVGGASTLRPIAPRFPASTATVARTAGPGTQIQIITPGPRADTAQVANNPNQSTTRLVIQALPSGSGASQLRTIAPNIGSLPAGIQLPAIFKDGVVYVPQPVQQNTNNSAGVQLSTVQIAPGTTSTLNNQQVNGVQDSISPTRVRKPCNCTKSQCLKLYCDCFANGEFCSNCNCNNCFNNIDHDKERSKAIKSCLERNPYAFHPKIGKGKGETDRRHNKGCHCKRSGCLKNYCECYEAKILCTKLCKCTGCKNFEESPERKTLMHLADAAEVRVQQQNAAKTKLESQMEDLPSRAPSLSESGGKLPFSFVTRDVVEATCRCLLLQAVEAENSHKSKAETQKLILEEFGSCLKKIINTANKRTGR